MRRSSSAPPDWLRAALSERISAHSRAAIERTASVKEDLQHRYATMHTLGAQELAAIDAATRAEGEVARLAAEHAAAVEANRVVAMQRVAARQQVSATERAKRQAEIDELNQRSRRVPHSTRTMSPRSPPQSQLEASLYIQSATGGPRAAAVAAAEQERCAARERVRQAEERLIRRKLECSAAHAGRAAVAAEARWREAEEAHANAARQLRSLHQHSKRSGRDSDASAGDGPTPMWSQRHLEVSRGSRSHLAEVSMSSQRHLDAPRRSPTPTSRRNRTAWSTSASAEAHPQLRTRNDAFNEDHGSMDATGEPTDLLRTSVRAAALSPAALLPSQLSRLVEAERQAAQAIAELIEVRAQVAALSPA